MDHSAPSSTPIEITTAGRGTIRGQVWLPDGEPRAVVAMHPATATPARFYSTFAQFLTEQQIAAVTYDYRGTGRSGEPREFRQLRMRDWMSEDVPAAAEWVAEEFAGVPQFGVGHSIGGHALALNYGTEHLDGIVLVASHVAARRRIENRAERARVGLMLNVVAPTLSRVMGYVPAKRLGVGEDMPTAAVLEWGRWMRQPHYFFDDETMAAEERAGRVTVPVLAAGAADDQWGSPGQVDALAQRLVSTQVTRVTYTPQQLGVDAVGHHGLLRRRVGERAWPDLADWLFSTARPH